MPLSAALMVSPRTRLETCTSPATIASLGWSSRMACSRVAGNSRAGSSGDGGLAITAQLGNASQGNLAIGVAVDGAGNLFIADASNNRIRKVSASGIITTVAGNGSQGFSGDGGPAINAQLAGPNGAAVD